MIRHSKPTGIDLFFNKPGDIFECRNGTRLRFAGITMRESLSHMHRIYKFMVQNGTTAIECYRRRDGTLNGPEDVQGQDIVKLVDPDKIDLSTAVIGQEYRLRNGTRAVLMSKGFGLPERDVLRYKVGDMLYRADGCASSTGQPTMFDIVTPLGVVSTPSEKKPPRLDMEKFKPGHLFRRRDGKLTRLVDVNPGSQHFPYNCKQDNVADSYTKNGDYMTTGVNPKDLMSPVDLETHPALTVERAVRAVYRMVAKLPTADARKARVLLNFIEAASI